MSWNCGTCNKVAHALRITFATDGSKREACEYCGGFTTVADVPDCYVPAGGMHFEGLSHPDFPESRGGTFCPDKATKAYYLKKYGLQESGDRRGGTNNYDPIAARHARESLRK